MLDFRASNHGSVCLLTPLTSAAREFVELSLPRRPIYWGESIVVEPRYFDNLATGIECEGLTIELD